MSQESTMRLSILLCFRRRNISNNNQQIIRAYKHRVFFSGGITTGSTVRIMVLRILVLGRTNYSDHCAPTFRS